MSGDSLNPFTAGNASANSVVVWLRKSGATYQIRAGLLNDAGTWTDTGWYDVPNAWSAVEIHYQAFANSGSLTLWLDDVQKQSLTFIDNDTRTLTDVRLGAQGVDATTSGTLYFDDFESRRFSYIGTLPDPGVNDPQATNQPGWFARTYQYSATIPHAVTSVNPETGSPDTYSYDANGNMTCRIESGVTFKQDYNAENRISAIHKMNGTCSAGTVTESWLYAYDGDGVRVSTAHYTGVTLDSTTSYYMGGAYEVTGSAVKKYYSLAGQTIMRDSDGSLKYMLTDHLGSTSAVVDGNGTLLSQQRYLPFGEVRTIPNSPVTQTDFTYTGQRDLPGTGVMDYDARFYSPSLGKFLQADTIVSNASNPQDLNRFSYVNNRSIIMNDPSGHSSSISRQSVSPIVDPPKNRAYCATKSTPNAIFNMNKYPVSKDDYMVTYTTASIGAQNPLFNRIDTVFTMGIFSGKGPAKITDAEMIYNYGDSIPDPDGGDNRGIGLGLGVQQDQHDFSVAFTAMNTRIQVRLDMCEKTRFACTPTDIFMIAALGGDKAIDDGVVRDLGNGFVYKKPDSNTGIFRWENFLTTIGADKKDHDLDVLQQFVNNVSYLQNKGAAVPNVNWKYICDLLK